MADKITLKDVHVSVTGPDGTRAILRGATASIHEGEIVALIGPSGSGKTTLLNVVGGLEPAFAGTVLIDGEPVWNLPDAGRAEVRSKGIGYVFQDFNLIPDLSVEENLALPLLMQPHPAAEPRARVFELLTRIGLLDSARTRADRLSGGERQRVAIVRALVTQPEIVLVDEPTGNLDEEIGHRVIEILLEYRAQHRATMLIATHDERLKQQADRTLQLRDGVLHALA
ncbi:MAG: ABC transporter ATP-binding protein [Candidatus Eisenbacteria bacterium]|uniref:ABC transporter ATP-binding protein n=1 Tax=Eiseniibacteriota bacterium TaxID=2212470 RepID=A0A948W5E2_UNCEI|nr:ABC transporter ATP-binding protein [Candidatus Eisenbacteria bacterium]MBU1949082.1 ABC transporter ATP-binding protein [Candidatus Eisenbacteria bacterium]MBU2689501.1 ABC transporter ATP-binding protein [Candidatus Eisenbacteria bacterium]